MSLKEQLFDWTDIDMAAYYLAISLGLLTQDVPFGTGGKSIVYNQKNDYLFSILDQLFEKGILDFKSDGGGQYKWRQDKNG